MVFVMRVFRTARLSRHGSAACVCNREPAMTVVETLLAVGGDGGVGSRIAIATHEDVGTLGAAARVYGVFAPKEKSLLPQKYDLRATAWKTVGGSSPLCGCEEAA